MIGYIKFIGNSIVFLFRAIVITIRYIITLSALSVTVVTRRRIGLNVFGIWYNKPFGTGEGEYKASTSIRILTILLMYVWVRTFFIWNYFENYEQLNFVEFEDYQQFIISVFTSYIRQDYIFSSSFYDLGYDMTIPILYSYYVVALGFAHIISVDILYWMGKKHNAEHLGYSLIFWFLPNKTRRDNLRVWVFYEPLLMLGIGLFLYLQGYFAYACFFGLAGASMFFQGYFRYRRFLDDDIGMDTTIERSLHSKEHYDGLAEKPKLSKPEKESDSVNEAPEDI